MEKTQITRLLRWLFIVVFFVFVPAITLYVAALLVQALTAFFPSFAPLPDVISEFYSDLPMILLTFYAGTVGGVVAYVFGRTQIHLPSDNLVTKMAKLLFAGSIGVAVFFLLRSAALVKLFYPKISIEQVTAGTLNYHSVIVAAFMAGLVGPSLVRAIQNRAQQLDKHLKRR